MAVRCTMETKWNFKCTQLHLFINRFQFCQFAHKCQKSKHTTLRSRTPTQSSFHQEKALDDTHRMQKKVYYNGPNTEDEENVGSVCYSAICQNLDKLKICELLLLSLISLVMVVIMLGTLEIKQGNEKITIRKLVYSIVY